MDSIKGKKIRKLGIFANIKKEPVTESAKKIISILSSIGVDFVLHEEISRVLGCDGLSWNDLPDDLDMLIALGGDGSMLSASHNVSKRGIPILGINLGRLGFLTELDPTEIESAIPRIANGEYFLDSRMTIEVELPEENDILHGLNEVVIDRGCSPRIVRYEVFVSGEYVSVFYADGVIVSTPTGSTAYSMAAHGVVLEPQMRAMQILALSPYTLAVRPLVVDSSEEIKIRFHCEKNNFPRLSIDGQIVKEVPEEGEILVRKSPFSAHFVHYHKRSFFTVLRDKLGWANQP